MHSICCQPVLIISLKLWLFAITTREVGCHVCVWVRSNRNPAACAISNLKSSNWKDESCFEISCKFPQCWFIFCWSTSVSSLKHSILCVFSSIFNQLTTEPTKSSSTLTWLTFLSDLPTLVITLFLFRVFRVRTHMNVLQIWGKLPGNLQAVARKASIISSHTSFFWIHSIKWKSGLLLRLYKCV